LVFFLITSALKMPESCISSMQLLYLASDCKVDLLQYIASTNHGVCSGF